MSLKIIQWNIRHVTKNKASLSTLCTNVNPHIICLQETWSHTDSNLNIPGYSVISHTPRLQSKGGGVAILASKYTPISPIKLPPTCNLEICAASLFLYARQSLLARGAYYGMAH